MGVKHKQGIIFSLISIGLSGLFIILFSTNFSQDIDEQNEVIRSRVLTLDDGITDFYTYAGEALQVTGRSALDALYREINDSGNPPTFLASGTFESRLTSCLDDSTGCSNPQTLEALLDEYSALLESTRRMNLSFEIEDLYVITETQWSLTLVANISIVVRDEYANWHLHDIVSKKFSTIGAYDPAYLEISSQYGGNEERQITPNKFQDFYQWNPDLFMVFYTSKAYHSSTQGGCLSDRYEGTFTSTDTLCSLESIVNPDEHPQLKDPANYALTHMDYQILSGETHECLSPLETNPRVSIRAVDTDLVLSKLDAARYNLTHNTVWYFVPSINATTAPGCLGWT